jgi:RNA polymerase sigma-70 factor (ECF subfamily)
MTAVYKLHAVQTVPEAETRIQSPVLSAAKAEAERARMSEAQVDQLLVERVQKGDKQAFEDRFRGDSAFYTWLYRIAINTAKNWLVARKRRPPSTDIDAADAEQYDLESRLKEQGTPESELMREEIKRTIYDTIAELPDDLRTAIMLREMEGMSYEDIAITMDCPIGTVRSRIFRAREAIDEKLKPLL